MGDNENKGRRKQKLLPGNHFEGLTQANIHNLLETHALPPDHGLGTIQTHGAGAAYTSNVVVAGKDQLLRFAVRDGNVEKIRKYFETPVDPVRLQTLLHETSRYEKRFEIAQLIFELAGANVNADHLISALSELAGGNMITFQLLLNNPHVDINSDVRGKKPIVHALDMNREEFIMALLNHPDIEITDDIILEFKNAGKTHLLLQSHLRSSIISRVLEINQGVGEPAVNLAAPAAAPAAAPLPAAPWALAPLLPVMPLPFGRMARLAHLRQLGLLNHHEPKLTHSNIAKLVRNRAWTRRRHAITARAAALAAEARAENIAELQHQAAQLRGQLAAPELTPAQKAGIAARSRALTKKANNLARNNRRRRNTRRARKH